MTVFVVLAPVLGTYGVKSGAGPLYYLYGVLVFLALPVIPLIIASFFSMVIMRFTNIGKRKDLFRMIGGVAAVFSGIAFNVIFQSFSRQMNDQAKLESLLQQGNNSLLNTFTGIFPSSRFAAGALVDPASLRGLANLGLFLGATALLFLLFLLLGEWLYFRGVMGLSESFSTRKVVTGERLDRMTASSSALKALTFKELRVLFRTPAFFINCVLMNFLFPIIFLIPLLTQPDLIGKVRDSGRYLENGSTAALVLAVGFTFLLFTAASSASSTTSFSREGQGFYILKHLPVSYGKMIAAKVITSLLLSAVGLVLLLGTLFVLVKPPVGFALALTAAAAAGMLLVTLTGMLFDLRSPKLNWDNEQKAVKQNVHIFFNVLVAVATGGVCIVSAAFLRPPLAVYALALIVLLIGVNFLLYQAIRKAGPVWLERVE
ncbi:hypothetical protein N6H14_13845 [Paenibacillus sp. CC-CFT747]|nr:hypothetical protein N6H14_13845 [Paenibacillus sp. CC-CFT747]